eukprot:SAG25_NODE_1329_length_3279_cov_494.218553_4_plen_60_part_00
MFPTEAAQPLVAHIAQLHLQAADLAHRLHLLLFHLHDPLLMLLLIPAPPHQYQDRYRKT